MTKGCEHHKRSFSVPMPVSADNKAFEKSCEVCKNKDSPKCDTCRHWSDFKRG